MMISTAMYLNVFHILLNGKTIVDLAPFLTPTPSPTVTTTTPTGGLDSTVVAALIGLAGVVVGALLAGVFAIYQLRRNAEIERQRQQEQFRHEQEIVRMQEDLKRKEREEQRQEKENEATQAGMRQARTLEERVAAYRLAFCTDPRIARLQILDMNRPVAVADIYVRLRVHQETRPGYELDPLLQEAEQQHNPNAFLKVHQQRLEQRVSSALSPEEAIRTYKRCIVVGDPGAGKSTLLKHLALLSLDQQLRDIPDLPIHIELQAFASSGHLDLLEYAATIWKERYGFPKAEALEYMQAQLGAGHALLLLDALDETLAGTTSEQAEASYLQASKSITDLATCYPQAPMLVTARKAGYHQRPRLTGFTELEVLDFRPEDIKQFVTSWFASHPDPQKRGNATDLTARLERNPHMQTLAANPLLLSLIVIVYEEQLDLPERRAELYKQCVDTLLTKWDASRNIRRLRAFKPEHKRHLLEEVAWHFHLQGQRYFPEGDLLEMIAAFLPAVGLQAEQNGQVLDEIVAENGLLKEQAHGWYSFLHLTLQEYCTAQYAIDQQRLQTLLHLRDNPWWEEVLFLYAGRVHDASPLLHHLLGIIPSLDLQDDLFHSDLLLAGRCLTASPTIRQARLREEIIEHLFRVVTSTPYSLNRKQATETLAEIGGKSVNERLMGLLSNEQLDTLLREEIARALGQLGERSVAPQLVILLLNMELHIDVRRSIARALGQLGERSVAPQLVVVLSNEQLHIDIRVEIARALGQLGERSVAPQLVALLSDELLDTYLRGEVANALGQLGERSVVSHFVALLSNEHLDINVREEIARVLGQLGERSVAPQLAALLSDEQLHINVRRGIVSTLGQLGERSVTPQLAALLSIEQLDINMHGEIASTLGQLGERSVAPQLVALLSNEQLHINVRRSIARALGQLGERSVAPQLAALLSNKQFHAYVRREIARALGQLGERSVAPQLVALLSDEQLYTLLQGEIARALGQLGERSVAPQLVALLSDEQLDTLLGVEIANALGQLHERSVTPQFVALLSNEQLDINVRRSIAEALEIIGATEETVQALAHLLLISDIADTIHHTLWTISRQLNLRITITNEPPGQQVKIVKSLGTAS